MHRQIGTFTQTAIKTPQWWLLNKKERKPTNMIFNLLFIQGKMEDILSVFKTFKIVLIKAQKWTAAY